MIARRTIVEGGHRVVLYVSTVQGERYAEAECMFEGGDDDCGFARSGEVQSDEVWADLVEVTRRAHARYVANRTR